MAAEICSLNNSYANTTKNKLGAQVIISNYTQFSNMYTFGSDGYLELYAANTSSSYARAYVYGSNASSSTSDHLSTTNRTANTTTHVFVRKGMKAYTARDSVSSDISFFPLV